MEAPWVTVVTPSYNQGRFLRRAIDSVLAQSYPNVELIVMDGGSTDESRAVLRSYGDRFFWRSGRDGGQADAINQGLRRARGSILAYLNSDDLLEPHAAETVVRYFRRQEEWDLIYGRAYHLDADGRRTGWYPTEPFTFARLLERCVICQPAAFWRRRVQDRIGLLDARLRCALDYDYWLRLAAAGGRLVHIPETLAGSRLHPATKTNALRRTCLAEAIAVCRAHAGAAPMAHYHAYWQERTYGAGWDWARLLAVHPALARKAAWWHRLWRDELQGSRRALAAALARRGTARLRTALSRAA